MAISETFPAGNPAKNGRDVFFALGIVVILGVLFLPIPAFLIDIGLAFSIALSVLILMWRCGSSGRSNSRPWVDSGQCVKVGLGGATRMARNGAPKPFGRSPPNGDLPTRSRRSSESFPQRLG